MKVHSAQRCLSWFGKLGACPSCSFASGATTVPSMWDLMKRFHRAVRILCAQAIGAGNMSQENKRMCGDPSTARLPGIKRGWCFLSTDVGLLCVQNLLWWLLPFFVFLISLKMCQTYQQNSILWWKVQHSSFSIAITASWSRTLPVMVALSALSSPQSFVSPVSGQQTTVELYNP